MITWGGITGNMWHGLRVSHDGCLYLTPITWIQRNLGFICISCNASAMQRKKVNRAISKVSNWFRALASDRSEVFQGPIETEFTADSQTREKDSKRSRGTGVSAVLERERFSLLHYSSNWHNDNTMCGVSAAADSDLSGMAHCLVSGTPDMLMHRNKIKPDTLIDLGMYNWEMQGWALFSATLTYCILYCIGQQTALAVEQEDISWKRKGILSKCVYFNHF